MNVVYTSDENYAWLAGISMLSVLQHNHNVTVYFLGWELRDETKSQLRQTAKNGGGQLVLLDVSTDYIKNLVKIRRWPPVAFARLFIAQELPETVNKVLYLDCDTIVRSGLGDLWSRDMGDKLFCGVKDCLSRNYRKNIGLQSDSIYLNSGVLLINVEKLRKVDMIAAIDLWFQQYGSVASYPDQDMLNAIFQDEIGVLEPKYNMMTSVAVWNYRELSLLRHPTQYYTAEELREAREEPAIIHFTTSLWIVRPWFWGSQHPYVKEFDRYMGMSVWKDRQKQAPQCNAAQKVMKCFSILPSSVSLTFIGAVHAELYPFFVSIKNQFLKEHVKDLF